MMKTSVLRQARFCRVALGSVSRVQISSRAFPSASPLLSSTPRAPTTQYRALSSPLFRLYSSSAEAESEGTTTPSRVTKFSDLKELGVHDVLIDSIVRGMKYTDMTEVQSMTISAALDGKDLVAQAKTGTGKTLAFLVPIVQRILAQDPYLAGSNARRARSDDIRAIIISPTRELAEQIAEEAKRLVRNTSIKVQTAVGGTQRRSMLLETQRNGCHLLVATPGRLADLLEDERSRIDAPRLQALVLDEADRMLEQGFQNELDKIVGMLPDTKDVPRQTLLFSATIPRNVIGLARTYINEQNFDFVQTISADDVPTHESVPQHIVPCRNFSNMYATLLELIEKERDKVSSNPDSLPLKAIVFLPTTASVVMTAAVFQRLSFHDRSLPEVFDIHSKLTQVQRTNSANRFRKAKSAILFSSDVTARGMDFPGVTHVIQLHLPPNRDQYVHRIGRTGRAGKEGQAWLLVGSMELGLARKRLGGLPINRNTELSCATVDAAPGEELPPQFEMIKKAVAALPSHIPEDAYRSYLGGAFQGQDMQQVADQSNDMAVHGWGLSEQPAVPERIVRNMRVRGLRVSEPHRHDFGSRSFGGGDDRFGRMIHAGDRRGGSGNSRGFDRRGGSGRSRGFDRRGDDFASESFGNRGFDGMF